MKTAKAWAQEAHHEMSFKRIYDITGQIEEIEKVIIKAIEEHVDFVRNSYEKEKKPVEDQRAGSCFSCSGLCGH